MEHKTSVFIHLKDLSVLSCRVTAFAKGTVPQTLQTPQAFAIAVWLVDLQEPLYATYFQEDERDADLEYLRDTLEKHSMM